VFNKIDQVPELASRAERVERNEYGNITRVFLSARTGQGLDALRDAVAEVALGAQAFKRDPDGMGADDLGPRCDAEGSHSDEAGATAGANASDDERVRQASRSVHQQRI
jgi:GTP-binding protein HflX